MTITRSATTGLLLLLAGSASAVRAPPITARPTVARDPRLDLAGIVQVLARDPLVGDDTSPAVVAVRRELARHESHEAVTLYQEMQRDGFSHDAVPRAVLHLGAPPRLDPLSPPPTDVSRRAGGAAKLDAWIEALRRLSRAPDVAAFLGRRDERLGAATSLAEEAIVARLAPVAALLGDDLGHVRILLGPLVHRGSFGPFPTPESAFTIVLGPLAFEDGMPSFGASPLDGDHVRLLVRSLADPMAAAHATAISRAAGTFPGIEPDLRRLGVATWEDAWKEHVARAVAVVSLGVSEDERRRLVALEAASGFVIVPALVRVLSAPGAPASLAESYPRLVEAAAAHAEMQEVVVIDPRIELMAILQLLGDHFLLARDVSPIRRDALAWFRDHRNATAVELLRRRSSSGFSFDAVPKAFAHLTPPPALALRDDVPPDIVERAGGAEALAEIAAAVREFHRASDFDTFFRAHSGSHAAVVSRVAGPAAEALEELRAYSGEDLRGVRLVLGLLLHDGGFAMAGHEGMPAQAFIGPVGTAEGLPDFGDARRLGPLVWHEFGHVFVNPLTARHADRVASLAPMMEPIRAAMVQNAYPDWPTVVNEHVVRALEVRLAARSLGEVAAEQVLHDHERRGFAYLQAVVTSLETYEASRREHPTLASYYPRLLEDLAAASASARRGDAP